MTTAPQHDAMKRASTKDAGGPMARLRDLLDYWPQPQDGDPKWKPWYAREGDLVEIYSENRRTHTSTLLARHHVVSASSRHFRIDDGRVFDQRGWGLLARPKSPIRARKVT